jgi:hypothetical protein
MSGGIRSPSRAIAFWTAGRAIIDPRSARSASGMAMSNLIAHSNITKR